MPRVLLLGGLDPSGGAGLTLDATVAAWHGAEPLPIAVAWTEQNRRGFRRCEPVPAAWWRAALAAVAADGPFAAVKLGMLGEPATVGAIAAWLRTLPPDTPIVVDPVLGATTGGFAPGPELGAAYRRELLPLATVFTPNLPELAAIGGDAAALLTTGARSVLVKGGHGTGADADDVLWQGDGAITFRRPRLPTGPVRGTGCALATAIACRLAVGAEPAAACLAAGDWLADRLRALGPVVPDAPSPRYLRILSAPPR
jgi:hydroxymethylpyrimidine/phosphomethylpyrimidine kinase